MPDLPSGTVTFLFTDIAGSTALWERDRAAMRVAIARQLSILQSLIAAHHGVLYKTVGDGTQAAFASAEDAVQAAVAAQRALLDEAWADPPGPLRVRMALHAGEAEPDERGDYLAAPLNRLARLLAIGHGRQFLLTQTAQQLTRGALPAQVTLRDLGEHRLRDLLEPERVFQLLHPELPDQFPSLQSLAARPTNLPRQPTPFLGREHEVGEIAALLRQPDVQLLTLTGTGGTGKTRLALQAAAELLDAFPNGVFFVPLAALADAALVFAAIAIALGVREEGGQPLLERVAAFLGTKQLLLVIDNWEHLLEAAPILGDLLRSAPGLTVLATSRAPLHLQAEREYPVPPLSLPRRKPPPTLEQLSQYEAVRLFIARAQAVKPDFAIDNESAPAVAEICHRLDGLPLAIELAAARLRLLPPQAMPDRLEKRLPLLTGGARDAPARQRTLAATIAWSYDLLQPEEQTLYRRLDVFSGGFGFHAAEAVTNPDGDLDVLAGVSALIDHSLVQQAGDTAPEPRFGMLETIREFGLEQLAASGEAQAVRDAHASWMVDEAERGLTSAWAEPPSGWLGRMFVEQDNIRSAFDWLEVRGEAETALRLAIAMGQYGGRRGPLSEARERLERALTMAGDHYPQLRAPALWSLGFTASEQGDQTAAAAAGEQSLSLFRAHGDEIGAVYALLVLGIAATDQGDLGPGADYFEEALAQGHPGTFEWAWSLNFVVTSALIRGDDARIEALHDQADLWSRQGEDPQTRGLLSWVLVDIAQRKGEIARAARLLRQVLALVWDPEDRMVLSFWLDSAADTAAASGRSDDAVRLLGAAEAAREQIGRPLDNPLLEQRERLVTSLRTELGDDQFSAIWHDGRALAPAAVAETANELLLDIEANAPAPGEAAVSPYGLTPH